MGVTLNKDGRPRKIGSGKTKGAGCYAKITWKELKGLVDEDSPIQVSRVWLRSVQNPSPKSEVMKLESEKAPTLSPQIKQNTPKPRPPIKPEPEKTKPTTSEPVKEESSGEYEPPPLFATADGIRSY